MSKKIKFVDNILIDNLSHELRGIGSLVDGKKIFVDGALPDETVNARAIYQKKNFINTVATDILTPSPDRITPKCKHSLFNASLSICGACSLQHLEPQKQIELKESLLKELLQDSVFFDKPITSKQWHYRGKARLSCNYDKKKDRVWIGFREKLFHRVVHIDKCCTLIEEFASSISDISLLIEGFNNPGAIVQLELAVGEIKNNIEKEERTNDIAVIFRHIDKLTHDDISSLIEFFKYKKWRLYLQSGGLETIKMIYPSTQNSNSLLSYFHRRSDGDDLELQFFPTDFTQVNLSVNNEMVAQAIRWLELGKNDVVLDLFSGIGNFSLPIAKATSVVTAIESNDIMVHRCLHNAKINNIDNLESFAINLYSEEGIKKLYKILIEKKFNKILIDPPRAGAKELLEWLLNNKCYVSNFEKIIYISCNPLTFIRDKALLYDLGYSIKRINVLDMFPQTNHIETMALFEKYSN